MVAIFLALSANAQASSGLIVNLAAGNGTSGSTGEAELATSVELKRPHGVTADSEGNVYIVDGEGNRVLFVPKASGTYFGQSMTADHLYRIAGTGTSGSTGDGGAATSAKLSSPTGITVDSSGDVFIADTGNKRIQMVPRSSGTIFGQSMTANDVYTVAGKTGEAGSSGDGGSATSAKLSSPNGVAVDSSGDLFIADTGNDRVQMVPKSNGSFFGQSMTANDMYTIAGKTGEAGFSGDGFASTSAKLSEPQGITLDVHGNLYIADTQNKRVRLVPAVTGTYFGAQRTAGDIYTVAGNGGTSDNNIGVNLATKAEISEDDGVAVDSEGNLYVIDDNWIQILFVPVSSGSRFGQSMTANYIYSIAGHNSYGSSGNGGLAVSAAFTSLYGMAVDSSGDIYVADGANYEVREIGAAPENTALPAVSGVPAEGQTMTATNGTWAGSAAIKSMAYSYQWQLCNTLGASCSNISGATSSTYSAGSSAVGGTLRAVVTATNGLKSVSATSAPTRVVTVPDAAPTDIVAPALSGFAAPGETLTASTGSWSGTEAITYTYQWQVYSSGAWESITGATSSTYVETSGEAGKVLRAVTTATNEWGASSVATNEVTVTNAPVNTVTPTLSGGHYEEETLTIDKGTWRGSPTPTYHYHWEDCNEAGESCSANTHTNNTQTTYEPYSVDEGKRIRVTVEATNSGGTTYATTGVTGVIIIGNPVNTALPEITGSLVEGSTLTVSSGTWTGRTTPTYSYHWNLCNTSGSCSEISGATSTSFTLTSADVEHTLYVHVGANNSNGSSYALSPTTGVVSSAPPTNTVLPTVSGVGSEGRTLTAAIGTWTGSPMLTYSYQWQNCNGAGEECVNISGATSETLVLGSVELGDKVRVVVTASNSSLYSGGVTSTSSTVTAAVATYEPPASTSSPTVTGNEYEGQTLTTSSGSWAYYGPGSVSYSYQWQRCSATGSECSNISGATSSTHALIAADAGHEMRAVVTADSSVLNVNEPTASTVDVQGVAPTLTTAPAVTGALVVGNALEASSGLWSDNLPLGYSYQWKRCNTSGESCSSISGATSATYSLASSDYDYAIVVTVKASIPSADGGENASASSEHTETVGAAHPSNTVLPSISGTEQDGATLTITEGTWSGFPIPTYTYQWQINTGSGGSFVNISGATNTEYALVDADVGYEIRAVVTASNSEDLGGSSASATSNETTQIKAVLPHNNTAPSVSGTTKDGNVLSATHGVWSGVPAPTYSYQWQRCEASGGNCQNISGATSETYALVNADVGSRVDVVVTASNASYYEGGIISATSAETSRIEAVSPADTTAPAVSGENKDGSVLTATTGAWSGAPAPTYSYQWQRNSGSGGSYVSISGATSSEYTLIDADVGYKDRVAVTASNSFYYGGGSAESASEPSAEVEAVPPTNSETPTIAGSPVDGSTLTTNTGAWSGAPSSTYSYQWRKCNAFGGECANISGATNETYPLTDSAVGCTIDVVVTASNSSYAGGASVNATSGATGVVQATPPVNTEAPVVSGELKDGSALTITSGAWEGAPTPTYSYQWMRNSGSGGSYVPISSATSPEYRLVDVDVGRKLKVIVLANNSSYTGGGKSEVASAETVVAQATPPANTSAPTVSGEAKAESWLAAARGSWSAAPAPDAYSYQWQRSSGSGGSFVNIGGATSSEHKLVEADVGYKIRVVVTASNSEYPGGGSASKESNETGVVQAVAPANEEVPTISGEAKDGGKLFDANGFWTGIPTPTYSYQWQRNSGSGGTYVNISGAIESVYWPGDADMGHKVRVSVTASNAFYPGGGSATSASNGSEEIRATPPANTGLPVISGEQRDSSTLTASSGTWEGAPAPTYSYQWQRCNYLLICENISGATASTYVLGNADVDYKLQLVVTATNSSYLGGGSASKASGTTELIKALPPSSTAPPVVSGTFKDGSTLTATSGEWRASPAPTEYVYQWQRNTGSGGAYVNISGATASTYTLANADVGHKVRVNVIASNGGYYGGGSANESSEANGVNAAGPVNTAAPVASGEVIDGSTLRVTKGEWSGAPEPEYSYQWQRNSGSGGAFVNVSGATFSEYKLVDVDVGYKIRVVVTASNAAYSGGSSVSANSNEKGTVQAVSPSNIHAPTITGEAQDTATLIAHNGEWSAAPAPTYSYQWQRNSGSGESYVNISGATTPTYTLGNADVGYRVRVNVMASNESYAGGGSKTVNSSASEIVKALPPTDTTRPNVSGTTEDGAVLTATSGEWRGAPSPTYSYQWKYCNSSGEKCENISGATSSTYAIANAYLGDEITVTVTASNTSYTGGGASSSSSIPTSVIGASPPINVSAPAVSGEYRDGKTLSVTNGSWTGQPAPTYTYQWQINTGSGGTYVNISGATSPTYTLIDAEVGYKVRTVVTASNSYYSGGSSVSVDSNESGVTQAVPPSKISPPTISGEPRDGFALSASSGTWSGAPASTYSYQWQRCNVYGESCSNISGATGSAYTLTNADVGSKIIAVVTASNASYTGGGSATSSSSPYGPIGAVSPTLISSPVITGEAQEGEALTTTVGSWLGAPTPEYSYQWQRCNSTGGECISITGAVGATYVLQGVDVGEKIEVRITASNVGGSNITFSSLTPVVRVRPITASAPLPEVTDSTTSGSFTEVDRLLVSNGVFSGGPVYSYLYQWHRGTASECNVNSPVITGAREKYYTTSYADVGSKLCAVVTATNATNSASETSSATPAIIVAPPSSSSEALPSISDASSPGSFFAGDTLRSTHGFFGGGLISSYSYQWHRGGINGCSSVNAVIGENSEYYTATESDIGHELCVVVTATNTSGSAAEESRGTPAIVIAPPHTSTPLPAVTDETVPGAFVEFDTLAATHGTFSGGAVASYSYYWYRGNATECNNSDPIIGSNSETYTTVIADVGHKLCVGVEARNTTGYAKETSNSTPVMAESLPPYSSTPLPIVTDQTSSGSFATLDTLTTTRGVFTGGLITSYHYKWYRGSSTECDGYNNGQGILVGNNTENYTITEADVGHKLCAVVEASNGVGSAAEISTATPVVVSPTAPHASSPSPVITDTTQSGTFADPDTLSVTNGTFTGEAITYSYQWYDYNGVSSVAINGATANTYTLQSSDISEQIYCVVTANNSSGSDSEESSKTPSIVLAPPTPSSPPVISGANLIGAALSATHGVFVGDMISYSYQWYSNEEAISGANTSTYKIQESDLRHTISVKVTASNSSGSSSETSASTSAVTNVDTWTGLGEGAEEGQWGAKKNWTGEVVPTASDEAFIPSGDTIFVYFGKFEAASLSATGATVHISVGGTLSINSGTESEVSNLVITDGGTLTGNGDLTVANDLEWISQEGSRPVTMSGKGATILKSGSAGVIERKAISESWIHSEAVLNERALVNHGTLTIAGNEYVYGEDEAQISNYGSMTLGGELVNTINESIRSYGEEPEPGPPPTTLLTNEPGGTLAATPASENVVRWGFNNQGTVNVPSDGLFTMKGGEGWSLLSVGDEAGTWNVASEGHVDFFGGEFNLNGEENLKGTGAVGIAFGVVNTPRIQNSSLAAYVGISGSLKLNSSEASSLAVLDLHGSLSDNGNLDIYDALDWIGPGYSESSSTMSGTGETVLETGSVSEFSPNEGRISEEHGSITLDHRRLLNYGTIIFVGRGTRDVLYEDFGNYHGPGNVNQAPNQAEIQSELRGEPSLVGEHSAELINYGSFAIKGDATFNSLGWEDEASKFINDANATVTAEGSQTSNINWPFQNQGHVTTKDNTASPSLSLFFNDGGAGVTNDGSWETEHTIDQGFEFIGLGGSYQVGAHIHVRGILGILGNFSGESLDAPQGNILVGFEAKAHLTGASTLETLGVGGSMGVIDSYWCLYWGCGYNGEGTGNGTNGEWSEDGTLTVQEEGLGGGGKITSSGNSKVMSENINGGELGGSGELEAQNLYMYGGEMVGTGNDVISAAEVLGGEWKGRGETKIGTLDIGYNSSEGWVGSGFWDSSGRTEAQTLRLVSGKVAGSAPISVAGELTVKGNGEWGGSGNVETHTLNMEGGELAGSGSFSIEHYFRWTGGTVGGTGSFVLEPGSDSLWHFGGVESLRAELKERTITNKGTVNFYDGPLVSSAGSVIVNAHDFYANSEAQPAIQATNASDPMTIDNTPVGLIEKTAGTGKTKLEAFYHSETGATKRARTGKLYIGTKSEIERQELAEKAQEEKEKKLAEQKKEREEKEGSEKKKVEEELEVLELEIEIEIYLEKLEEESRTYGGGNPSEPHNLRYECSKKPVNCATGNEYETQTDVSIGGLGLGLHVTRTYNSKAAEAASSPGVFGYGWTFNYEASLLVTNGTAVVRQGDGATASFTENGSGEFVAPPYNEATLTRSGGGDFVFTLPSRNVLTFNSKGQLVEEAEKNGNATQFTYEGGLLTKVTDPTGRSLTFTYNEQGMIASVEDPERLVYDYEYDSADNLVKVYNSFQGETHPDWRFGYDEQHQMTTMVDADGNETVTRYEENTGRVDYQHYADGGVRTWSYAENPEEIWGLIVTVTEPNSSVTREVYSHDELMSITHAYGTPEATTITYEYNSADEPVKITNGDEQVTKHVYGASGDLEFAEDPMGRKTHWTYGEHHEVKTETTAYETAAAETTTYEYDSHGNLSAVWRPVNSHEIQEYRYKDNRLGELENSTDPLSRPTTYEYDSHGDLVAVVDAKGYKTTSEYNADSVLTSATSPLGNVTGATQETREKYTTKYTVNLLGEVEKVEAPESRVATYSYSPTGQRESVDANGRTTTTHYDSMGQVSEVEKPGGQTAHYAYNLVGELREEKNANNKTTLYEYGLAGRLLLKTEPLNRKTAYKYDAVGNVLVVSPPESSREEKFAYNPDSQLETVTYAGSSSPNVTYSYNGEGKVSEMVDSTGHSIYEYDHLGRLVSYKNGAGTEVGYGYNLDNDRTSIAYPGGHVVHVGFNEINQEMSVEDWLGNTTSFEYNANGELETKKIEGNGEKEKTAYNYAGEVTSMSDSQGSTSLFAANYAPSHVGLTESEKIETPEGETSNSYGYGSNGELTSVNGANNSYDAVGNPVEEAGKSGYEYNEAQELTSSPGTEGATRYEYNEVGDRVSSTPASSEGNPTSYSYNSAGYLASVTRPEFTSGSKTVPALSVGYGYNGNGLRESETVNNTTKQLTWDVNGSLPLLIGDGTSDIINGPEGLPLEEINTSNGAVEYYHHDERGSTVMLTNGSGTATARYSYTSSGVQSETMNEPTGSAILGFAGQLEDDGTGLVYMRARVYDPATLQFLSVDPLVSQTMQSYSYAGNNPVNAVDPSGLAWGWVRTPGSTIFQHIEGAEWECWTEEEVYTEPSPGLPASIRQELAEKGFIARELEKFHEEVGLGAVHLADEFLNTLTKEATAAFIEAPVEGKVISHLSEIATAEGAEDPLQKLLGVFTTDVFNSVFGSGFSHWAELEAGVGEHENIWTLEARLWAEANPGDWPG